MCEGIRTGIQFKKSGVIMGRIFPGCTHSILSGNVANRGDMVEQSHLTCLADIEQLMTIDI